MTITLNHDPEYGQFDLRECPIWAIPQLAELRRRVSPSKENPAVLMSFRASSKNHGVFTGSFVIDVPGAAIYFGYINSNDMNNEHHEPSLYAL